MIERIENVSRDYAGYILKVTTTYDYDVERHDFDSADELEAYCAANGLVVDTDCQPYDVSEWSDGAWLIINAIRKDETMTTTKTIDGITYETIDHGEGETLTLATFTSRGVEWTISVLSNEYGEVLTTADWQGEQPASIAECDQYEWVPAEEWSMYDMEVSSICESIVNALSY